MMMRASTGVVFEEKVQVADLVKDDGAVADAGAIDLV